MAREIREAQRLLLKAQDTARDQVAQIAEVHNSLAKRFAEMQDQLNAHEIRFGGQSRKVAAWPGSVASQASP